ncbi:MAG: AroM family protein [Candidatus Rokubacteria bacterium]|nr:AroM family protein [Candidatus Rokubacteria bacterium]
MKVKLGMVTIGQAPRTDVVPEMAELLGPAVEILERGALDSLSGREITALAPGPDDEILVTRLADGGSVFIGKRQITPRVQQKIEELEAEGVTMTALLCTGTFHGLRPSQPLLEPDKILLGVLRGLTFTGRVGVLTPSARHVPQTEARWRGYGFDPVVVPLSPYEALGEGTAALGVSAAARTLRGAGAGLVLLDCIGFRRQTRQALQAALHVPVVVANLLVARVVAELLGT